MNKKVFRAGVVPYYVDEENNIKMLFMKPSDAEWGGDQYQIGKGKVEEDESTEEAALREAGEELGLFRSNISYFEELGVFLGRTTVYIAKIKDKEFFGQPNFETESVCWLSEKEFNDIGRNLHLIIVQAAVKRIKQLEKL